MRLYREFGTQAELDWEYRPELLIDDPRALAKITENLRIQSTRARQELQHMADVSYGPTRLEKLDIYPSGRPNAPIAIFIHGGYWFDVNLTKETFAWAARGFNGHGVTTVIPDYAVCPTVTVDEIVRQCRAVVAWVYRRADEFGGDRSAIYVTGNSAGGHLTAMTAVTDWEGDYDLPGDVLKGACAISGLFDLEPFPYTWLQPKIQLTGQQIKRNSPILHIPKNGIPLLISWGAAETKEFWRQSEEFGAAWERAGNPARLQVQEGCDHFQVISGFGDPQSSFCRVVVDHMSECLARSSR
jgi:arylformamidase